MHPSAAEPWLDRRRIAPCNAQLGAQGVDVAAERLDLRLAAISAVELSASRPTKKVASRRDVAEDRERVRRQKLTEATWRDTFCR